MCGISEQFIISLSTNLQRLFANRVYIIDPLPERRAYNRENIFLPFTIFFLILTNLHKFKVPKK